MYQLVFFFILCSADITGEIACMEDNRIVADIVQTDNEQDCIDSAFEMNMWSLENEVMFIWEEGQQALYPVAVCEPSQGELEETKLYVFTRP